uniref:3'-5' exonuclease domain-containing protein n=1 Tax=Bionectria ochroleuca TaxID=29856 RepID=A0A8H7NGH6_BIOOC
MSIGYGGLCAPTMRYSSLSHPSHYLQKYLNRTLRYKMNRHLWNPNVGIRFSSGPETKAPLYPILNVSRYVENLTITDEDLAIKFEGNNKHGDTSDSAPGSEIASPLLSLEPIEHDAHSPLPVVDGEPQAVEDAAPAKTFGPPSTSLPYKISPDLFYKARDAKEGSPESFWSHTMYNMTKDDGIKNDGTSDGGTKVNVKVHYCRSKQTMETTCQSYFLGESLLGFDMEWQAWATKTAGVRSNVALIQLASESHIGLFHVALFPKEDFVAPTFRKIMGNPNISKAGVNIRGIVQG